ncbi:hypothetical protein J0H58_27945 [bacterium]|nr:hypothetical protein [bacterium]
MSQLAVCWDGRPVGVIAHVRREGFCISGRFVPGDGFDACRAAFEEAYRGDEDYQRAIAATGDPVGADRERWHAAVDAITPRVTLPGLGAPVEEFNVFADGGVEVYLSESDGPDA